MNIHEIKVLVGYDKWDILKETMVIRRFLNYNLLYHSIKYEDDRPTWNEAQEEMDEVAYQLDKEFFMDVGNKTRFKAIASSVCFGFTNIVGSFHNLGQLM